MPFETVFNISASVTFSPVVENATTFNLSAVDGSNPDLIVTNNGVGQVSIGFGPGANASGLNVQPGTTALLTSSVAILAACASNPLVIAAGSVPSLATTCAAIVSQRGGAVTIARGTAVSRPSF